MHTSLQKIRNLLKQEGTSRQERYVPALHKNNLLMDDRRLQDIIAYMQRYSKNLLFVNAEDEHVDFKKSWEYFFKNDILFLIANIATKNVDEIRELYTFLFSKFNEERSIENFIELIEYVFSRLQKINEWYVLSAQDSTLQMDFNLYIRSYLKKELENIREMLIYGYSLLDNRSKLDKFRKDLSTLDPIWEAKDPENIALREQIFRGNDAEDKLTRASLLLSNTFDTIFHAIESIVRRCATYFEEAIQKNQQHGHNHHPHVALVIAFLRLFDYVKEEMNKIPQRHLDFYYKDVLRIKEKKAVPDETFVIFELAKGFKEGEIKKGTQVSAGKDKKNKELIYETEKDIIINKASVQSLQTLFIDRNENNETLNYYRNEIPLDPKQAQESSLIPVELPKIFGDPKTGLPAEIGFAIASSQFYLAKGERNVTVIFESPGKIEPCKANSASEEDAIFDKNIIKILLTAEKGWISSDDPKSELVIRSLKKIEESKLELQFSISIKQEQAIVPFDKELHDGNFDTAFPVLQCILKYPTASFNTDEQPSGAYTDQVSQLCTLKNLQVKGVKIIVQVGNILSKISFDGVSDLILENDETILDNKKPFYPFTASPKVGSSFYIGCGDLFYKKILELSVNMEWVLPDNFNIYYQKYLPPYDSNKFTASLSLLDGKRWKKISDFSIIDPNANNPKFKSIKLNVDKLKQKNVSAKADIGIPSYDTTKKNGTIRLKLNYPDFGHSVYPQLITSTVMEIANSKSSGVDYYKVIKNELSDSKISIKLPEDIKERSRSLKVIYDILQFQKDDELAKTQIIKALSGIIREYNNEKVTSRGPGQVGGNTDDTEDGNMMVNDSGFVESILKFLRNIRLVDKNVHYDKDKEGLINVVDEVKETINRKAHFVMPSDQELVNLIKNETNAAINKTIINIVDEILATRVNNIPDVEELAPILRKEFDEVNLVINDMIAKKIAIHLSALEIPPPPYSPQVNTISLNYSSDKQLSADDNDKIFRINPLGIFEASLLYPSGDVPINKAASSDQYIFPKSLLNSSTREMLGMFFIGIMDLVPNQNVSILVQLAEGSRINDKKSPVVNWFYLSFDNWIKLASDNIVSDNTYGLQTTGIIELSIPYDAANNSVLFNSTSLYWLCASVEQDTDSFPNIIAVRSQAARVVFKDNMNDPDRLALPLEAEKIKTLVDEIPEVKKVSQPAPSFNGKLGENDKEYYSRVSERLRHKSRAINNWDYERLILDEFSSFFKVKCLNNYYNGHFAVGHVTVVPIPDLRNRNYAGANVLMPKINYLDLRSIEKFLLAKSSPFAKIHAVNPQLEYVLISCKVKFKAGIDKGFYLQKLNEDLINFLTPWAAGDTAAVSFSAKIYSSSIINFIDMKEYVNYVVDLVIQQYIVNDNGKMEIIATPGQLASRVETELTTAHSILVSAPKHEIELVN
ncbi:MAG: hypothetical protein ABIN89_17800 [Chitinophagaceae bacterium]